jgi:hypothetical protein
VPLAGLFQALPKLPAALAKRMSRPAVATDLTRFEQVMPLARPAVPRA